MKSEEIRQKFLEFFKARGHAVVPSASLVPENDPTTLFTGSGMQPLIPYLLGEKHPMGVRLVNSQKSFRAEDIEEIGDNRHTTFFEMLGNWSLGDYFKKDQLAWFFKFLTEEIGLDPHQIYVTVFTGDEANGIPRDEESAEIWKNLFVEKGIEAKEGEHIFYYGTEKNWWSRAGVPEVMPAGEPGGPDSEVFYLFSEVAHNTMYGEQCHPNCDCGRFVEIGNSVFMEYRKKEDGTFEKLAQQNVDFGGGLERITAAVNKDADIFMVDTLSAVVQRLEKLSGKQYSGNHQQAFRVIADHIRGAMFMIADGVFPSNTDRGYFVRRLVRRAVRHADMIGLQPNTLSSLTEEAAQNYRGIYPELDVHMQIISDTIAGEEQKFRETLERGLTQFAKMSSKGISGKEAFDLYQSYGFPFEITQDLARENNIEIDKEAFQEELRKHQELSRGGAEKKFKGGLADTKEHTVQLHTAHHLLLAALREVLGEHVHQRGSNITSERLRIDFSHPNKLTPEELKRVGDIVNQKIRQGLDVIRKEMPKEEAMGMGAEMEFGVRYGDTVSVYTMQDAEGNIFSKEFCGGPHVANTRELGHFTILKEEASSAGVRRIRADVV